MMCVQMRKSDVRFKEMCKTRWVERHEAFDVFIDLYLPLVSCLEDDLSPIYPSGIWGLIMYPRYSFTRIRVGMFLPRRWLQ